MNQSSRIFLIYGCSMSNESWWAQDVIRNWGFYSSNIIFYRRTNDIDKFNERFEKMPKTFPIIYTVNNGKEELIGNYDNLLKYLAAGRHRK